MLLQFLNHFLAVLVSEQVGLQPLDGDQDLLPQAVVHDGRDRALQHVVPELVEDELPDNQGDSAPENLVDRLVLGSEADLNDVARELELAQPHEVDGDLLQDEVVAPRVLQLEHVLHQVVAELVLDEVVDVGDDLVRHPHFLLPRALFQASLHHAAPVFVGADFDAVVDARLDDEVGEQGLVGVVRRMVAFVGQVGGSEFDQNALQHVIAVDVIDQPDCVRLQHSHDRLEGLGPLSEPFHDGLHHAGAVNVAGDRGCFVANLVHNHLQFSRTRPLDDFLTEVVSELVHHGVFDHRKDRFDESCEKVIGPTLTLRDLLLDQSAADLVEAVESDVVNDLLLVQRKLGKIFFLFFFSQNTVNHSFSDLVNFLKFRKVRIIGIIFPIFVCLLEFISSAQINLVIFPNRVELVNWHISTKPIRKVVLP